MILADQIRHHVRDTIIQPARQRGARSVTISAGDVHAALGLKDRMPAVCGALDADKFLDFAHVSLIARSGPGQGSTAQWVFALLK